MKFFNLKSYLLALVLLLGASEMTMAQVAGDNAVRSPNLAAELEVPLYKSRILSLGSPISRISVGNPDIADLLLLRSSELYVLGKDLGTTNVLLWDSEDRLVATVSVEIVRDLDANRRDQPVLGVPEQDIRRTEVLAKHVQFAGPEQQQVGDIRVAD